MISTLKDIISVVLWCWSQWWFWVVIVIGMVSFWYLFRQRSYKEINHKLFIRHGRIGKWLDIEEHFKTKHPLEYELIKREQKKQ